MHNLIVTESICSSAYVDVCVWSSSRRVCVSVCACVRGGVGGGGDGGVKCQSVLLASQGTIFSMSSFVLSEQH